MSTHEIPEAEGLQPNSGRHRWRRKIVGYVLVAIILVSLFIGMFFWLNYQYNEGQISVVENIAYTEEVVRNFSSSEVIMNLSTMFPQKLNYTDLLDWESRRLNYTENRIWHADPIEILSYGKGACGEFSILYISICLANSIPARLVMTAYLIPNVVDHSWAEVNPLKDGKTWIDVEVTDAWYSIKTTGSLNLLTINNTSYYKSQHYRMLFAYQLDANRNVIITDRTAVYSSGR
jgi:hypothetical protein